MYLAMGEVCWLHDMHNELLLLKVLEEYSYHTTMKGKLSEICKFRFCNPILLWCVWTGHLMKDAIINTIFREFF